jgi:hypothetical protein
MRVAGLRHCDGEQGWLGSPGRCCRLEKSIGHLNAHWLPDKCGKDAFDLEALRAPTLPHYYYYYYDLEAVMNFGGVV